MAFTAFLGAGGEGGAVGGASLRAGGAPGEGAEAPPTGREWPPSPLPLAHLYWIASDVVDARNFVMRILTMLNRNTKLIWREGGREGMEEHHEVPGAQRQPHPP